MNELRKLYIEATSNCNLSCKMCFRNTWFDETFCDLDYDIFTHILDTTPQETETVFFAGMGEPLHHPKILSMIKDCVSRGYKVELLTNGSLLTDILIDELINLKLYRLWVSLDMIEPETRHELGHPQYINITKKLKAFNRARHKVSSRIQLGITFVASKSNVNQLNNLPLFITKYYVDEVNISNLYPSDIEAQKEILYERTLDLSIGSEVYAPNRPLVKMPYMDYHLPEVKEGFGGLMSKMNFQPEFAGEKVTRKSQKCPFVTGGMTFIKSDGNVTPCMELLHNGTTVMN